MVDALSTGGVHTPPGAAGHDAFLSYSRVDRGFAVALESALERYRPPRDLGLADRHMDVFRDEEDFTGTEYKSAVARHLRASRKLIVICTPAARSSPYVAEEIRLFAEANSAEHIIPILLAGIPNNEGAAGQDEDFAFPDALCEVMAMPLAVSYRSWTPHARSLTTGQFEGAWLTLLANLYDIARADLEQRERRRQLRARRIWASGAAAIILVLSGLTMWALLSRQEAVRQTGVAAIAAEKERNARLDAERQRQIALTRQLAALAELTINQQPHRLTRSVLLAVESLHPDHQAASAEGYQALRHGLGLLPPRPVRFEQKGPVQSLAMSPDGAFFATVSRVKDANVVTLWTASGAGTRVAELLDSLSGPSRQPPVTAIAVSPEGRYVALLRVSGVDIWEPRSAGTLTRLTPGIRASSAARFSHDGRYLAVLAYAGGLVRVWNVGAWDQVTPDLSGPTIAMGFTLDGRLVTAGRTTTLVSDVASGARSVLCNAGARALAAFSPDASHAVYFDGTSAVRVLRLGGVNTPCVESAKVVPQDGVTALAVTSGGSHVAVASSDGTARLWTIPDGREFAWMTHDAAVASVDFDRLGDRLVTMDRQGVVNLWDVIESTETRALRHSSGVRALAFGPDPDALTTVTQNGAIQVWSLGSARGRRPAPRVVHDAFVTTDDLRGGGVEAPEVLGLAFSPGGRFLGMLTSEDELLVWNLRQANSHRDIPVSGGDVLQFAISADGTLVAFVMQDGSLHVISAGPRADTEGPPTAGAVSAAAFEPAGQRLATVQADGTVAVRGAGNWQPTTRLSPGGAAGPLVWSPGGRYLATAAAQNLALIWDVRNGQVTARVPLDRKGELRALSPDGAHLATIGTGGQASVWEARSGQEVARVTHGGVIQDAAFSPDGNYLATAGTDLIARVWRWRPEDLIAAACERLTQTRLSSEDWQAFLGSAPERPTCAPAPVPRVPGRN